MHTISQFEAIVLETTAPPTACVSSSGVQTHSCEVDETAVSMIELRTT